jgi:hypothetical protein
MGDSPVLFLLEKFLQRSLGVNLTLSLSMRVKFTLNRTVYCSKQRILPQSIEQHFLTMEFDGQPPRRHHNPLGFILKEVVQRGVFEE